MKDNEIIKAVECCLVVSNCTLCPLRGKERCLENAGKQAVELFNRLHFELFKEQNKNKKLRNERNRLKEEIEWLENENTEQGVMIDDLNRKLEKNVGRMIMKTCKNCIHCDVCVRQNIYGEFAIVECKNHFVSKADVVSVVRCKDCKNYKQNPYNSEPYMMCMYWNEWFKTDPDDFCSYGEKRSEGK